MNEYRVVLDSDDKTWSTAINVDADTAQEAVDIVRLMPVYQTRGAYVWKVWLLDNSWE